ncbi:MAG: hypothetical protein IJT94_00985 [Oscillibacter sp.]|nr:hypothetical protein [Oscillibacter sp.]
MARQQQYTLGRVFVGGRPLEDLTAEERTAFQRRTVQRMGDVLNSYFSRHPDVYVRVCEKYAAEDASPVSVNVAAARPVAVQEAMA